MNTPTSSSDDPGGSEPGGSAAGTHEAGRRGLSLLPETCPICGGAGFVVPDLPISHADFGKAVPCTCREQERLTRRMRRLQSISSLHSLQRYTFASFIPDPGHLSPDKIFNLRRAFETSLYFAEEPEGWLLLTGTYGCGKTHLAAAIANSRLEHGESALFMVAPDLLDHLRSAFSPHSDLPYDSLFDQVRATPLLILDDLGAQSSTPWAQEKLFQLLNHRYMERLPTVITTNQRLDEIEPRLRSRLTDPNLVTHFHILAPDFRMGKNPSQSDLSTLAHHREQTFEKFEVQRADLLPEEAENLREVFTICRQYADEPKGWLVLAGTFGSGKTHLAASIANVQKDTHSDVMFVVVPDLLDHLRAAYSPQATTSYDRRFDEVKNAPLLILDDLGTESATPWAREKLFQLLNYRYNALLPTVITTSSTPDEIEPWLRTRMFDTDRCRFCGIRARGYRRNRGEANGTSRGRTRQAKAK